MSEKVLKPMWGDLRDLDRSYLGALSSAGGATTPRRLADLIPDTAARSLARTEQRLTEAGHIARSPYGVINLAGPLDRSFIQAATELEALYRTGAAPAPPAGRKRQRRHAQGASQMRATARTQRRPPVASLTIPQRLSPGCTLLSGPINSQGRI